MNALYFTLGLAAGLGGGWACLLAFAWINASGRKAGEHKAEKLLAERNEIGERQITAVYELVRAVNQAADNSRP